MRFGEVFAGIGGWALGLERAGWRCAWQIENDPFCNRVLAKHWPSVERRSDVREVDPGTLTRVDAIVGSPPCQDISNAGTLGARNGLDGFRSGLFFELLRLAESMRPQWVMVENVESRIDYVPIMRRAFFGIDYASVQLVLHAGSFGARHVRARSFVVAHADGESEPLRALHEAVARLRPVPSALWNGGETPSGGFRMGHGVPNLLDRCRVLGNSVSPVITEWLARQIDRHNERKINATSEERYDHR